MKTTDYTVLRPLGFSGCGSTANPTAVDVLDGKVVRTRPVHFDDYYDDLESLRPWKIEKNGHVLDIGDKTYLPIYSLAYKKRTYSRNRIPFPMKRVDWDPNGDRNPQTRGKSKFERISWDEALDIVANEIKRIRDTYGRYSIFCEGDGHGENKVYSGAHGCNIALMGKIGGCTTQLRNADSWEGWYWGAKHV
jgi:trimethylamine-N-oxide reductase (cytochrome c)